MNPYSDGFVSYVSRFPWWIDQLQLYFDYFWFVALLAWSLALVLWWWHPRRATFAHSPWAWLPWIAGSGVITAAIEFFLINGEARPTPKPVPDFIFGALPLLAAAGWWWQAETAPRWRGWRRLAVVPLVAIAVWRLQAPAPGGWLATAAVLLSIAPCWKQTRVDSWSRVTLLLAALTPLFSLVGPLTVALHLYHPILLRNASVLAAGAFQASAATLALVGFARDAWRAVEPEARRRMGPELRAFALGASAWAAACVAVGLFQSQQQAVAGYTYNMEPLRRLALQLDRRALAEALGPQFHLDPASLPDPESEAPVLTAAAPHLASGVGAPIERLLAEVVRTTRGGLKAVSVITLRDGWVVVALSSNRFEQPGRVRLAQPVFPNVQIAWDRRADTIERVVSVNAGTLEFLRHPLVAADGAMLGWLEFAQARGGSPPMRTRIAPFVGAVLGVVVAALFFVQRQSIREREAALRAAAVAAESARVKTDFLAKVSHELRTPLQSVLGYGELLQHDVTHDTARARLAALRQNGEFMLRLVNDLLDLTAIEAGGFRFIEKPIALSALVRETAESLRPRASAKGLALHCEVAADFPLWVEFDGERFRQIILNLAGNAVKFTARGRVELTLAVVERTAGRCVVELAVRDTGPGIPPADQARLFQPFSRLDLTAHAEGTGLGLALTAALCRAAGGGLTVESDGRHGACFRARVVVRPCAPPATPLPATLPFADLRGRRILIVDDNALVRDLFAAWLADLGAACELAVDGEDALARGENAIFDAVVLDVAMPRIDGFAVARRWRAQGRTWRIVGVSAHASGQDRTQALAAGMDAFLTKPVELAALVAALAVAPATVAASRHERLRAQLAARFRDGAADDATRMREALGQRNWAALHARAHHLKSSAGVVGDEQLYAACAQVEDAADACDAPAADAAWTACEAALAPWLARR